MKTHQLVEHDQKPDTSNVDTISCTADNQFADPLSLQTGVPAATVHAVRRRQRNRRCRIDNSNVGQSLGGDLIQAATDIWL